MTPYHPPSLPNILIVDDKKANLIALKKLLHNTINANIIEALSGNEALTLVLKYQIAIILLDIDMPEMNGYEVAEILSGIETTRHIPIIFITAAYHDEIHQIKGYQSGAIDYIEKPINEHILLSKLRILLELFNNRMQLQTTVEQLQQEIEERKRAESQITELNAALEQKVLQRTQALSAANSQLKENQRSLETLVSNLPGMVYRCQNDANWSIYYISKGCFPLTGYSKDDFINNQNITYNDIIHPEDQQPIWDQVQAALTLFKPFELYYRIITKDRITKWVWEQGQGVFDDNNQLLALEGYILDITQTKQLQMELEDHRQHLEQRIEKRTHALAESEKRYRDLFENAPVPFFTINANSGTITDCNIAAERVFDYPRASLIQKSVFELYADSVNGIEKAKQIFQAFQHGQPISDLEVEMKHRDGSAFWTLLNVEPIKDKNGHIISSRSAIIDISNRKAAEDALTQSQIDLNIAKEKAEASNHAKSQFLANMSHEIRTPMNAIFGFSELLDNSEVNDQQHHYIQAIRTSGKNLLTLIDDILDLSKIEAGKLILHYEPVNPRQIIDEVIHIFTIQLNEKQLNLSLHIDERLPNCLILDETRLRQVLLNLIGNALKFTEQGHIDIHVHVLAFKNNHQNLDFEINITDTGIGIPAEQQEIIFDSFQQQDGQSTRKYGGTGLGLMTMMQGQISLNSKPHQGSTFTTTFYDIAISELPAKPKTVTQRDITFKPATILVVDDVEINRQVSMEILKSLGFTCMDADCGEKAIAMVQEHRPDLVIMDIRMPGMDGDQATQHIKSIEKTRNIPIIALTASVSMTQENKQKFDLFDGYLYKPLTVAALVNQLSRFLAIHPPENQTIINDSANSTTDWTNVTTISDENKKQLPQLMKFIEADIEPIRASLIAVVDIGKAQSLSDSLKQLGNEYQMVLLSQYAEQLSSYVERFDIQQVQNTLTQFSHLIESLKKLMEHDNE